MVRDMGVRKNIHIENWASYRENCEHYFKFSRGNWARLAVFGIAVPIACYMGTVYQFVSLLSLVSHKCECNALRSNS